MRAVSLLAFNSDLKHIDTGDNPVYAYKDGILFCEGTETFCKNSRELKDEVSVDGMWADVILSNAVKNGVLLISGKVETAGNVVKTVTVYALSMSSCSYILCTKFQTLPSDNVCDLQGSMVKNAPNRVKYIFFIVP